MVGVPGRSKGCSTCRKRKKGCDKKLPSCGQCLALGIQCEGYGRQPIWVNSHGGTQTFYSKSPESRYTASADGPRDSLQISTEVILHDSLTRTARTQKYTSLFWSDYSTGAFLLAKVLGRNQAHWIKTYDDLSQSEITLQFVTLALSAATLGAHNNDTQLKAKSLEAYGLAMRQMAFTLQSKDARNDGVLAAVQLMRVFEQLFGADRDTERLDSSGSQVKGFSKHVDGETALILSRGPDGSWSSLGRQLLLNGRLNLITASISQRRRSPFSVPQWKKSRLWQPDGETPLDKLMDILVEIPGLLEDLDGFRRASTIRQAEELHVQLFAQCQACELQLLAWADELRATLNRYDYTITGGPLPRPKDDDDLASVYLCCLYWEGCFLLYSTMAFCEQEHPQTPKYNLLDTPYQQTATFYVYRIARSIHMLFDPPATNYTAVAAFFILGLSLRYLIMVETYGGQHLMSPERLALVKIFQRPFLGSFVGRFLRNLQSEDGVDYGPYAESLVGIEGIEYRARVWWCGLRAAGAPRPNLEPPCFR